MNCIVFSWWGGHCCPMHCDLSEIYCAPRMLDTRTRICPLNFAQRPIFLGLRFVTSLKSQTRDTQLKVPLGGLVLRIFTSWKNPSTSAAFESRTLDLAASTVPQDHRGRLYTWKTFYRCIMRIDIQNKIFFFCLLVPSEIPSVKYTYLKCIFRLVQ